MIKILRSMLILWVSAVTLCHAQSGDYQAPKASVAPTIDGVGNDACWALANWYTIDQVWLGAAPTAADFTGKFKVTWDANKIYVLSEITDNVLNDRYTNPLEN
ncbi:MAG TPA: sugar-binding protein, partial [Cytophagales bacterium]|nr:sugar-binding protein [Cytophagales bacterium]